MLTRFSPAFLLTNTARDFMAASIVSRKFTGAKHKGVTADMMKWYPKAMNAMGAIEKKGEVNNAEWNKWAQEFRTEGGMTGYIEFKDLKRETHNLEKLAALSTKGMNWQKVWHHSLPKIGRAMDVVNAASENAMRLALYRALRERGYGKTEAANEAKDITVNFNRKGELSSTIGSFYMFFNAAVQGSYTLLKASPKIAAPLVGLALLGAAVDGLNAYLGVEEEWNNVPEYVRQRNVVIMVGGGDYITLPLPYGLSTVYNAGRLSSASVRGAVNPMEAVKEWASEAGTSWSPVGGDIGVTTFAPDVADPILEVAMNHNSFFDSPIHFGREERGAFALQSQHSQTWLGRQIAVNMYEATGLDMHPKSADHLLRGAFGGLFTIMQKDPVFLAKKMVGIETRANDNTLLRPFYRSNDLTVKSGAAYELTDKAEEFAEHVHREMFEVGRAAGYRNYVRDKARAAKVNPEAMANRLMKQSPMPPELIAFIKNNPAAAKMSGITDMRGVLNKKAIRSALRSGVKAGLINDIQPAYFSYFGKRWNSATHQFQKKMSQLNKQRMALRGDFSESAWKEADAIEKERLRVVEKYLEIWKQAEK
jgi:hypothetical protein